LPEVVNHNLTRDEAERLASQLARGIVEGHSMGVTPYIWEYEDIHAQVSPSNCFECKELVLRHCKHLLLLLEQERKKRA
jgi:hypothetical protein